MPAYRMKRKTSPRDLREFVRMRCNVLGSTRIYWGLMGRDGRGLERSSKHPGFPTSILVYRRLNFDASWLWNIITEGSLEVKLPTIWTDGKADVAESEKRRAEERRSEKRKSQRKEDAGARKGRKVARHCVFQCYVAPGSRKVGSLKRPARSHLAKWEMKNCMPLWRVAHFEVKMHKAHHCHCRTIFGSWDAEKCAQFWHEAHFEVKMHKIHHVQNSLGSSDVEKVHAIVARSTFRSQKC